MSNDAQNGSVGQQRNLSRAAIPFRVRPSLREIAASFALGSLGMLLRLHDIPTSGAVSLALFSGACMLRAVFGRGSNS